MTRFIAPQRGCLNYEISFLIGRRYLDLYIDPTVTTPMYSLFWRDEENPVQHKLSAGEVFNVLSQKLETTSGSKKKPKPPPIRRIPEGGEEYRAEITVVPKGIKRPPPKPKK